MNYNSNFTNVYSLSKTLRFQLRPVGKTMETIGNKRIVESDKQKMFFYKQAKTIIDNIYKQQIGSCLAGIGAKENGFNISDYEEMRTCLHRFQKDKSETNRKALADSQSKCRKSIVEYMMNNADLKLFSSKRNSEKIKRITKLAQLTDEANVFYNTES